MANLRLFNVSEYVHAGAVSKSVYSGGVRTAVDGSWQPSVLPVGGISFVLNAIIEYSNAYPDDILVFCVDDVPTIKRAMYAKYFGDETGYKGSRAPKNVAVSIQRKMIKEVLEFIGVNVLFAPGYEADDIIASLVPMYLGQFDEIIIHTIDSDLYSLVQPGVSIGRVGERGRVVNMNNFTSQAVLGEFTPFNTVLLRKIFKGDSSDNIPSVAPYIREKITNFIPYDKYPYLLNTNLLRSWVKKATNGDFFTEGVVEMLIPLKVPEEYLFIHDEGFDVNVLNYIGKLTNNKYVCNRKHAITITNIPGFGSRVVDDIIPIKEMFKNYADDYYYMGGE